jgi:hypothetical protein
MQFETFDSFEEMQEALARNEERADALVLAWQRKITVGDCVMRYDESEDLWIFTEIQDPIAGERECLDLNDPSHREHLAELERIWEVGGFKRNRRWGRHYSVLCPDGELGELHICSVTCIIPRAVFDMATREGADPEDYDGRVLARRFLADIVKASHDFEE